MGPGGSDKIVSAEKNYATVNCINFKFGTNKNVVWLMTMQV